MNMNEEFVRKAIQFKLDTAEKILERLPPDTSEKIRSFGHLIYESLGAHHGSTGKGASQGSKTSGKINSVKID